MLTSKTCTLVIIFVRPIFFHATFKCELSLGFLALVAGNLYRFQVQACVACWQWHCLPQLQAETTGFVFFVQVFCPNIKAWSGCSFRFLEHMGTTHWSWPRLKCCMQRVVFLICFNLFEHPQRCFFSQGPLGCGPNSGTVSAYAADRPAPVRDIRLGEPEGTQILLPETSAKRRLLFGDLSDLSQIDSPLVSICKHKNTVKTHL